MNIKIVPIAAFFFALFFGCKEKSFQSNLDTSIQSSGTISSTKTLNTKTYVKPDKWSLFFKSIDFKDICLENKALNFKEVIVTNKTCQIDIKSPQLNGGELDVLFFYESNPKEMQYFDVKTDAQKMKLIPAMTHRNIKNLGDVTFIRYNSKNNTKVLVMAINNVRVSIKSDLLSDKENCMHSDVQLEKMAKAIKDKLINL